LQERKDRSIWRSRHFSNTAAIKKLQENQSVFVKYFLPLFIARVHINTYLLPATNAG